MMTESWKPIKDYPDYEVSNRGRVKSFKYGFERILKPKLAHKYRRVELSKDGLHNIYYIHVLVAEAFIGPRPSKNHICNHEDGIKLNDDFRNLKWITKSEDIQHAYDLGLRSAKGWCYDRKGENNSQAKLKNDDVKEIKRLLSLSITHKHIAKMFNVSRGCISGISGGFSWNHISLD